MAGHEPKSEKEVVTLQTFSGEAEADLAKSALTAAGIPSYKLSDDCGGMRPSLTWATGVRLMVRAEDVVPAKKILNGETKDPE